LPPSQSSQVAAPSSGAIVPAAHGVGADDPVEHEWPSGHAVQLEASLRSVALEKRPAGQGSGAAEPSAQYDPEAHNSHCVLPLAAWYLPPSQSSQVAAPSSGAIVPAAHGVGTVDPVEHEWPSGQTEHCVPTVRPTVLEKRPFAHGSGADAPGTGALGLMRAFDFETHGEGLRSQRGGREQARRL
jgi:hypothetical protein